MQALERPSFETEASKRIYQHVERHGPTEPDRIRDAVPVQPDQFRVQVDRLKAKGYLESDAGTLRLAISVGGEATYSTRETSYTIRPARQGDVDDLVDSIEAVTAADPYVRAEHVAEHLRYDDTVTRHNTVESRVCFVAAAQDVLVGWTHLELPHVPALRDTARQTVGVRPTARGRGIGSQLLDTGVDWAATNGYRKVYNSIPATNENARAFLEARGWEVEAVRDDHYTIDGTLVDEVMMAYTPAESRRNPAR